MPIQFKCPSCQKPLRVKDEMAGKKGTCPICKKVLVVPAASAAAPANGPTTNGSAAKMARLPVDAEAEAAAVFSDKPAESKEAAGPIEFTCPMCDEQIKVDADLAGKNTPCPSCARIVKVPVLKKADKVDWKKPAGLPSLARQDVPAVEGVWDNREAARVSQEALEEAGALPEMRERLTVAQWVQRTMLAGGAAAFLVAGIIFVSHRAQEERQVDSLSHALQYLDSDKARQELGPIGMAELHRSIGLYLLRTRRENCAQEAQKHFDKAFELLRNGKGTERDLALVDLTLARAELGGSGEDVDEGRRLDWKENKWVTPVQKMVAVTLLAIQNRDLRLQALEPVLRRVIAAREPARVIALANQAFGSADNDNSERLLRMEAKSLAGVELAVAGEQNEAGRVADLLQQDYAQRSRPPLASSAVALMMALGRPALKAGKLGTDDDNEKAGTAEGLARRGEAAQARALIEKAHPLLKARIQLNLAEAALDATPPDPNALGEAFRVEAQLRNTSVTQSPQWKWLQWRLLQLGLRARASEEQLKPLVESLADGALRARGELALFEARLAKNAGVESEDAARSLPEHAAVRALAYEALGRHNIRHDKETARKVLDWPQPFSAFGSLGVACGIQGND